MAEITDDSDTVTRCLLDPYADERDKLERAAWTADWERELAIQLMSRFGFRGDELASLTRERWHDVSRQDIRRSWATYYMLEQDVDINMMMSLSGWSGDAAIRSYLSEPIEAKPGRMLSS